MTTDDSRPDGATRATAIARRRGGGAAADPPDRRAAARRLPRRTVAALGLPALLPRHHARAAHQPAATGAHLPRRSGGSAPRWSPSSAPTRARCRSSRSAASGAPSRASSAEIAIAGRRPRPGPGTGHRDDCGRSIDVARALGVRRLYGDMFADNERCAPWSGAAGSPSVSLPGDARLLRAERTWARRGVCEPNGRRCAT